MNPRLRKAGPLSRTIDAPGVDVLPGESKGAMSQPPGWIVYILECADQSLYTGITNDLDHRIHQHEKGTGAKYTRGRAPFTLLYTETHASRSQALKREAEIKSFDRATKLQLALSGHSG